MRLVKFLTEMAPFASGAEAVPDVLTAKKFAPTRKEPHKLRFVKKGKRMSSNKEGDKNSPGMTHSGGFGDVNRFKAWSDVGQTASRVDR